MKTLIKRIGAFCCAFVLLTLLCWPSTTSYAAMNGRNNEMLPDGIKYPMRRAVREGSEAIDDLLPDAEEGTVNDRTQGASDGVLDGTSDGQGMTNDQGSASESASGEGTQNPDDSKGSGMTTAAIVIACLAAIAIIVLIFIAIPKSKSKPGGTGNKN